MFNKNCKFCCKQAEGWPPTLRSDTLVNGQSYGAWPPLTFREDVDYVTVPPGGPDCADALADLARDEAKRFRIASAGWERAQGRFLPEHAAVYYLRVGTALFEQQAKLSRSGT